MIITVPSGLKIYEASAGGLVLHLAFSEVHLEINKIRVMCAIENAS